MTQTEDEMKATPKAKKPVPRTLGGFTYFLLKEILQQRKWLLFPLWVALATLALLIFVAGGSSLLPAIYIAF